jgi:hypothetical protein
MRETCLSFCDLSNGSSLSFTFKLYQGLTEIFRLLNEYVKEYPAGNSKIPSKKPAA